MSEKSKRDQIFEKVEDCILDAAEKIKNGRPVDVEGLQALFDGVRALHHIDQIKGKRMGRERG